MDAASGALRLLDRDEIIHGMLVALLRIGGDKGLEMALDWADQLQAGRMVSPGQRTTALLFDTKMREGGGLDKVTRRAEAVELDERELKRLRGQVRGGLFTGLDKRIAAIVRLGQARDPRGIGALLEAMGDKEPRVASSAHLALTQYMIPLPDEREFYGFWETVIENEELLEGETVERFQEFVRKEMPKNRPYSTVFVQAMRMIEDQEIVHRLEGAFRSGRAGATGPATLEEEAEKLQYEEPVAPSQRRLPEFASDLDRKRDFLMARREWVRGGKKGPPPEAPG
jgi:hypothetical protein